ncbi:MAG: DUF1365 domain-containing protein [Alphaproteobacteria bacterium]
MVRSAIYQGTVVHGRVRPKRHRLRYSVFSFLLDLDELPDLDRRHAVFAYNRRAPISFYDRDHGPLDGSPLRPWAEGLLRDAGIDSDGGPIRLLCYPRMFGYVFNPLSVYFCYDRDENLVAILYEVCNTFKERHTYVIPVTAQEGSIVRQRCNKELYVSPFLGMDCSYDFRILPPQESLSVVIRQEDRDGLLLTAAFKGDRKPFNAATLARLLATFPLMTFKIMAGIHWEAFRLWIKGMPVFTHQAAASPVDSSIVTRPVAKG